MGNGQRLIDLARKHGANKLDVESEHYCDLYERYMSYTIARLLEIGVQKGGSLKMWAEWYPEATAINGLDIKHKCKKVEHHDDRITVYVGHQADPMMPVEVLEEGAGAYDVIIDDGSHQMGDTKAALNNFWSILKPGGLYVIEDLHTSYWPEFGGKPECFGTPGSTHSVVSELFQWVHRTNTWAIQHSRAGANRRVLPGPTDIHAIHFHRSICFIEKAL